MARGRSARIFEPHESELLDSVVAGHWLRASRYSEAHKVGRSGTEAVCGRPLDPALHRWVIVASEAHKKCTRCHGRDYS